jgi:hypothetical protein
MTWKAYWTVIGIIYPIYYAINIAYDFYVHHRKNKQQTSLVYDVGDLFNNGIEPVVVNVEPIQFRGAPQTTELQNYDFQQDVESQGMVVEDFLLEVSREDSNIISTVYS